MSSPEPQPPSPAATALYPLVFQPVFKERLWGGRELARLFGKALPPGRPIGESWEIADRPGDASVIANGPFAGKDLRWLMEHHGTEVLGSVRSRNGRFPLLVKLLDARETLSVQVHPPARVAERLGGEPKTELWYVVKADEKARVFAGLRRGATRSQMLRKEGEGTLEECLHAIPMQAADAIFLPSGRLHALGAGLVVFEIQQNSDTTYRVFDWNRRDEAGNPRELHLEQALECIDFDDIEPGPVASRVEDRGAARLRSLAENPWFEAAEVKAPAGFTDVVTVAEYPRILAVVSGTVRLKDAGSGIEVALEPGQVCLLPASLGDVALEVAAAAVFLFAAAVTEAEPENRMQTDAIEATSAPAWRYYARHQRASVSDRPMGLIPSRRQLKRELTRRMTYMPFLKLLVLNLWFRVAVLSIVGFGLFLALFLPKIWRTTPADFVPVVRISGVDKVQSLMLQRTARRAQAARQFDRAIYAWGAAVANDAADLRAVRGYLDCLLAQDPIPEKQLTSALQFSFWLLRLGQTNQNDLATAVRVYSRYRIYELVTQTLDPMKDALNDELAASYAQALFFTGRYDEFGQRWPKLSPQTQAAPELALVYDAYQLGWLNPKAPGELLQRLVEIAQTVGPLHDRANRVLLQVMQRLSDPDGYARVLAQMQRDQEDSGLDHAVYWRLLDSVGRTDEARLLADLYAGVPRSARELVALASAMDLLGLPVKATALFQQHAIEFSYSPEVWVAYAESVGRAGKWDELNAVAVRMRENERLREEQEGFIDYLEGWSLLRRGVTNQAEALFVRSATKRFGFDWQAISAAQTMVASGYPAEAREVLSKVTPGERFQNAYWNVAFEAGWALKDEGLMLVTANAAFAAYPEEAVWAARRSAALLVSRQQPVESIKLTMMLRTQFPNSLACAINHAFALIGNRRLEEARDLLQALANRPMSADEAHSYALARFEMYLRLGRPDLAAGVLPGVDRAKLFPTQARWFNEQLKQLEHPKR